MQASFQYRRITLSAEQQYQRYHPLKTVHDEESFLAALISNPLQRSQARSTPVSGSGALNGVALQPGIFIQQHGTAHDGGPEHVFLVKWAEEDGKNNPRNFNMCKRASQELHVSEVVESIATGIYLLGFALGSLFSGPLSEVFGRNAIHIGSLGLFSIFIMASALAPNIGAQLAFRFLAGIFGCPSLT
ncbi:uncharacterized protein N7483_003007 [Penicillium malachiteum]|uniref:uncharacterized protein n=1 Tax=Penicillium malachiteum TaxID=1324776 RepID=UPI0025468BDA|nr:uncharacterized protein N7483_003007 [Penicillium malachiteum]KAJ5737882.1 hypothetical protein N7483_003007 [Penicillium malachiteum]